MIEDRMIEEISKDYSSYFKIDSKDELRIIQNNTDDMLTRLEEFDSLLHMVKQKSCTNIQNIVPEILQMDSYMTALSKRVDNLETLVTDIEQNLSNIEKQVNEAKTQLNIPGSLKSFLKPIFGQPNTSSRLSNMILPIEVIDIDKYFTTDAEEAVEVAKADFSS